MSQMFTGPSKPNTPPKVIPPRNTALDAQLQALARRQGAGAAMLTGPGGMKAGTPATTAHTVTGS